MGVDVKVLTWWEKTSGITRRLESLSKGILGGTRVDSVPGFIHVYELGSKKLVYMFCLGDEDAHLSNHLVVYDKNFSDEAAYLSEFLEGEAGEFSSLDKSYFPVAS